MLHGYLHTYRVVGYSRCTDHSHRSIRSTSLYQYLPSTYHPFVWECSQPFQRFGGTHIMRRVSEKETMITRYAGGERGAGRRRSGSAVVVVDAFRASATIAVLVSKVPV